LLRIHQKSGPTFSLRVKDAMLTYDRIKESTMRITENTPSHLRLRDRTLWISMVCFAAAGVLGVYAACDQGQFEQLIPAALSVMFGLAFLRATDVTFDKVERTCVISRLDVVRVTRMRLAFGEIVDARVEIEPLGGDSTVLSCRLSLVTASAIVPVAVSYEPDEPRYNAMRETVLATVFGDGKRPAALDPIRMLVKDGRIIDAVAMLRRRDGLDLTTASARIDELRKTPDS
jgi:hypothetical protein